MVPGRTLRESRRSTRVFKKVLVANRGEIAVRVIRACRELGIATVGVYSDADRNTLHVRLADEAIYIGPAPPLQSYLNVEHILGAAQRTGSEAIHPGYGFLAENASFARACQSAGVVFIGPCVAAMEQMGGKLAARTNAQRAGLPVVPGSNEPVKTAAQAREFGDRFGYPIAIKASAGGGGKGLKIAMSAHEVDRALSLAAAEAAAYFADATLYVERYLLNPKHVEVQVLGDRYGNAVHLGERDCSLQRRHQKLVEESPAQIDETLRVRMHESAVRLTRAIGYDNAGTIECLVAGDEFFFLEMNTRIQVEHTITEAVYGVDLVKAQIRIASGEPLPFGQGDVAVRGHAIECRINAESPADDFSACPGTITAYIAPGGPGVRVDSAAFAGSQIAPDYDSLIAKLVTWGAHRTEARERMLRALAEYDIEGVTTTIPLYRLLLQDGSFVSGGYSTSTVDEFMRANSDEIASAYEHTRSSLEASDVQADGSPASVTVEVNDKRYQVSIFGLPALPGAFRKAVAHRSPKRSARGGPTITAPMHGIVVEIRVKPGDDVSDGQVVAVIEAMKMMNEVVAHSAGKVASVNAKVGERIETGSALIVLDEG